MKYLKPRTFAICSLVAISALVFFPTEITAATKCRSSDFACFKRKMIPKVGRKITVVGVLASAKLGRIVKFNDWGVYIYAVQDSDNSKLKTLDSFDGQTVKVTGILRYSPGSPPPRTDVTVASVPEHFFFDVAEAKVTSTRAAAEMTFREMRYRKPPLAELYFDVVLRNDRGQSRWFLLPSNLNPEKTGIPTKGGVDALEVFASHGKGRVIVGHFLGTGGFHALLLPGHAEVRLRMFPISYWGDLPDRLQVEVVTAKRLTIAGKDAATWFKVNPTSSVQADISENPTDSNRMIRSRRTPDNREVTTHFEQDQRIKLQVSLRERN
jgi:hypothetical protein